MVPAVHASPGLMVVGTPIPPTTLFCQPGKGGQTYMSKKKIKTIPHSMSGRRPTFVTTPLSARTGKGQKGHTDEPRCHVTDHPDGCLS